MNSEILMDNALWSWIEFVGAKDGGLHCGYGESAATRRFLVGVEVDVDRRFRKRK